MQWSTGSKTQFCAHTAPSDELLLFSQSVQSLSRVRLFATPRTAARQASLSFTISPGLAQTHVYWVSDAIQPSHPLSSPFPPTFNLSQHQGLFKWVSSSHQVAKVSASTLAWAFQWIFRIDFVYNRLLWSPCRPRDFQESSPTPQLKSISSSALRILYGPTFTSIHDY